MSDLIATPEIAKEWIVIHHTHDVDSVLPLGDGDLELIQTAKSLIEYRADKTRHRVAAALRTTNGHVYQGLHLLTGIGSNSVCAEASAIAAALLDGNNEVDTIVAALYVPESHPEIIVIPPCGRCRELIWEYGSGAKVIIQLKQQLGVVPISKLLPMASAYPKMR